MPRGCPNGFKKTAAAALVAAATAADATADAAAAEMDALVQRLQQAEHSLQHDLGPAAATAFSPPPSGGQWAQQQPRPNAVHAVRSRPPAAASAAAGAAAVNTHEEVLLSAGSSGGPQVPWYTSCPTAVDEPLSPYTPPYRGCCTMAFPPQE